jgi:hypothetical protein
MPVRPLAAYRQRPVHKSVVRKNTDIDVITLLTEGEPLSVRAMRKPMKVLKSEVAGENAKKE